MQTTYPNHTIFLQGPALSDPQLGLIRAKLQERWPEIRVQHDALTGAAAVRAVRVESPSGQSEIVVEGTGWKEAGTDPSTPVAGSFQQHTSAESILLEANNILAKLGRQ